MYLSPIEYSLYCVNMRLSVIQYNEFSTNWRASFKMFANETRLFHSSPMTWLPSNSFPNYRPHDISNALNAFFIIYSGGSCQTKSYITSQFPTQKRENIQNLHPMKGHVFRTSTNDKRSSRGFISCTNKRSSNLTYVYVLIQ